MSPRIVAACATLFALRITSAASAQTVTLELDDTRVAPPMQLGIGINGSAGWYNFVGASLVDDPGFEGPEDDNGFSRMGWPWFTGGDVTASVVTDGCVSGQCQQVTIASVPSHMSQGRDTLPQAPLILNARPSEPIRIRARMRSDVDGARIQLGVVVESWGRNLGPQIALSTEWQTVEWDYVADSEHLLRGIAIGFADTGTFWIDDLVAWNTTDLDPATGLSARFVERLRELAPATLRLGGLGVNGIPLESYLRPSWPVDYGPPAISPDLHLNTFLALCREVGAQPFITVPPAFSNATSWQVGDLTDDVIANVYEDHGNLVDYIGGDAATTYGARRDADGHPRWDEQFDVIYFEMGNELWGTPDDRWDMDPRGDEDQAAQMENYATYCERRMSEMKGRPGWRSNMRVGFGGRSPATWLGGWPGSYDGTLVPAIGGLTDFSTIDLYYGSGSADDTDETIFGGLFASAVVHEREITEMRRAFAEANGGMEIETAVYEGNATWGGYERDLGNPSPLYFRSVSLGAAVSLVDVYAASNRAGVTVNNHFQYGGNVWAATGPYPDVVRKPAFHALMLLTRHTAGYMGRCTVTGSTTYDDSLTGETDVPHVACYPYRDGDRWHVLIINRHRSEPRAVVLPHALYEVRSVTLTADDINANNELSEDVVLVQETLSGARVDAVRATVPPFSALVLLLSETEATAAEDAGIGGRDAGVDAGGAPPSGTSDGCGCATARSAHAPPMALLALLGFAVFGARRKRR